MHELSDITDGIMTEAILARMRTFRTQLLRAAATVNATVLSEPNE
jgi:hypothetical protein